MGGSGSTGDRLLLCLSDSTATELVGNDELAWKDKATLVIEQVDANDQRVEERCRPEPNVGEAAGSILVISSRRKRQRISFI